MNNLFSYAKKELSQDAILCWCINWLNYPGQPLYQLGKAVLDLFLGKEKLDEYQNVDVKQQYEKIDILVLFSGKKNGCINDYALMIEDKTNTSEHSRQIERYKTVLVKDFSNRIGYSSYIKTGTMYDGDWLMTHNVNAVIDLNKLLAVIQPFQGKCSSDILDSFNHADRIPRIRGHFLSRFQNRSFWPIHLSHNPACRCPGNFADF